MSGEAWLYLFAVLINAVNLFLQVFFTIMYSDLEWYVGHLTPLSKASTSTPNSASCALGGWRLFSQQTVANGILQRLH